MNNSVQLQTKAVCKVPFSQYEQAFLFLVNGQEYYTSNIAADILSPEVGKLRQVDPAIDKFIINTENKGNFENVINLLNFERRQISNDELPFLSEIFSRLGTVVDVSVCEGEINIDNVIERIKRHENKPYFKELYEQEIDYASSHFFEINSKYHREIKSISEVSLVNILQNEHLTLTDEDSLLSLINELYTDNHSLSHLYEFVFFNHVSIKSMKEFIERIELNDITSGAFSRLSERLIEGITPKNTKANAKRYNTIKSNIISYSNRNFQGIIDYLNSHTNIKSEINITYSSDNNNGANSPYNLINYQNPGKVFCTENLQNSWICIEFKNHTIIPSSYGIMSNSGSKGKWHPKTWVIEGSNDKQSWKKLSEENNTTVLDGPNIFKNFPIQNIPEEPIKFIRIRQTGPNAIGNHHLYFSAFEVYGELI